MDHVRCPCGRRTGQSPIFFIFYGTLTGSCRTHKGAIRHSYGHVMALTQPEFAKIPHSRRMWRYGACTGPLRSPHGLFTGCLRSINPCGARKFIINALKLYGLRTGRQNSDNSAGGPYGPREWTYDFCWKQPVNSPWTVRMGPGIIIIIM